MFLFILCEYTSYSLTLAHSLITHSLIHEEQKALKPFIDWMCCGGCRRKDQWCNYSKSAVMIHISPQTLSLSKAILPVGITEQHETHYFFFLILHNFLSPCDDSYLSEMVCSSSRSLQTTYLSLLYFPLILCGKDRSNRKKRKDWISEL